MKTTRSADILVDIPTGDPIAALRFCRNLKSLLGAQESEPAAGAAAGADSYQPEISVVVPVYNEQENIPLLYERLVRVLGANAPDFELIFINDGSCDQTAQVLDRLRLNDNRVLTVDLARNFGHQVALSAGLDFSRGRGVIVMDADLQDAPEALSQFIARWREGFEVVYAIRAKRTESFVMRSAYLLFYRFLRLVANIEIPADAGDFCIMDRKVVDMVTSMRERNRFVRGLRSWVGFNQLGIKVERAARHAGTAKYTISRLVYLALDGFFSFSFLPLRIISLLGAGVSCMSLLLALFYAVKRIFYDLQPRGFATLVVMILFLAGVQLITIGVIGEYIGRIFEEVKQRPLYVVKAVRGRGAA